MKKNILIFTVTPDEEVIANQIKDFFADNIPTHSVVVLELEKYSKIKTYNKASIMKMEYYVKSSKNLSETDLKFPKMFKKNGERIKNAVLRFNPESCVAFSSFSLRTIVDSKKRFALTTPVFYIANSFTVDSVCVDKLVNAYIVENEDAKKTLTDVGVSGRLVFSLGLPFNAKPLDTNELAELKQELGLGKRPGIFVYADETKSLIETVNYMCEQGEIFNVVVYAQSPKSVSNLRKIIDKNDAMNMCIVTDHDKLDDYLSVCDIMLTNRCDLMLHKALKQSIPVVNFVSQFDNIKKDMVYLGSKDLVCYAESPEEAITDLYKILQTDFENTMVENMQARNKEDSLEMTCGFLSTFLMAQE